MVQRFFVVGLGLLVVGCSSTLSPPTETTQASTEASAAAENDATTKKVTLAVSNMH